MKLEKGELYEIRGSVYDDESPYIIKVNSDLIYDYYLVTVISAYRFDTHFHPEDWEHIRKLSSLEKEFL
jgi:hypothetical protein